MLSQEKEKDSVIPAKQGYVIPAKQDSVIPAKAGIHFFLNQIIIQVFPFLVKVFGSSINRVG
jgi:hypothetical protein